MAVIHISEEDAIRDFAAVLARVDRGENVVIKRTSSVLKLEPATPRRTVAESLAILESLPGERGYMDPDFANDVSEFRRRHPEGLDSSRWD